MAEESEEVGVLFWVIRVAQAEALVDGEEACGSPQNRIEPVHCYGIPSCPNLCLNLSFGSKIRAFQGSEHRRSKPIA